MKGWTRALLYWLRVKRNKHIYRIEVIKINKSLGIKGKKRGRY